MEEFQLTDEEIGPVLMNCASISSIHFYNGSSTSVIKHIQDRIASIFALNPWITCGLVSDSLTKRPKLVHCKDIISEEYIPDHFLLVQYDTTDIHPNMQYTTLCDNLIPYIVKNGCNCLDQDIPLFQVTLINCNGEGDKDREDKGFALMVSQSHVLGDGYSFYQLLGMLSIDKPVKVFNPQRDLCQQQPQTAADNNEGVDAWTALKQSSSFQWGALINAYFNLKTSVGIFSIDTNAILKEKQAHREQQTKLMKRESSSYKKEKKGTDTIKQMMPSSSYVSTNDILLSHVSSQVYHSDFISMVVDQRMSKTSNTKDKDDKVCNSSNSSKDSFWNCLSVMILRRSAFQTPGQLRQSLLQYKANKNNKNNSSDSSDSSNDDLPSHWERLRLSGFIFYSNWSSFYDGDLLLPGSAAVADTTTVTYNTPILHLPIINRSLPYIFHSAIIFCPYAGGKEQMMIMVSHETELRKLEQLDIFTSRVWF